MLERKVPFGQNPNIEIRAVLKASAANPKQIRIPNDKMTKTNTFKIQCFCHWSICIFVIVSYFVLRISNF